MKKVLLIVAIVMVAVIIATVFVGCSAESYKKQLERKGYEVSVVSGTLASAQGAEFVIVETKGDSLVTIIKFKDASDAKDARKEAKEEKSEYEEAGYNYKISGTGKIVKIEVTKK